MGLLDHPSSSGGHPRGSFGIDWAKWFPPVTSRSFLSHYLPASGAVSHTLYTVHLFSPNIISSLFPTGDLAVSNTILFNANVGLGFYVYFRRHLHRVNPWERVEFSVLASTLFNFGSLLAAVLIKALFPSKSPTWLKSLTGTVLSGYLLSRAYKYMGLLDTRSTRGSVSPARSVMSARNVRSVASTPRYSAELAQPSSPPQSLQQHVFESPPTSAEQSFLPMTPSATENSVSDFGEEPQDVAEGDKQNFRYLHSYALSNLNHSRPKKESILRRTTMNQTHPPEQTALMRAGRRRTSESTPTAHCFVTPEPSLKELVVGVYTPPPSRIENRSEELQKQKRSKHRSRKTMKKIPHERDDFDRLLDLIQWHAPLALVPFAVGCFVTNQVPMYNTMRFIFTQGIPPSPVPNSNGHALTNGIH